ncbi:MAG: carbohydrate kinase [Pleurocapsa sp.]
MDINAIAQTTARVICLGEILFDCLADELGKSVEEVTSWTSYPGGAPANVACALVKLGTSAAFIGCIGKDEPGAKLVRVLQETGVNIAGVQYDANAPTRKVYVTRSTSGDRTFAGFGDRKSQEFADAFLQADKLLPELFLDAEFLVLGTLELAYPQTREAVFKALKLAEEYNLKVVLDVNWRPMFWQNEAEAVPLIEKLWEYVDFIKLAEEEALWLFHTADAGAISYRLGSVEGVLVSNGDAQVSYCLNDYEGKITPFSFQVKDTTGAGDAFLAGFVHQLCQRGIKSLNDEQTVKDIVTYACAVGGLTTTKPGAIAAQPMASEVEAFLQAQK